MQTITREYHIMLNGNEMDLVSTWATCTRFPLRPHTHLPRLLVTQSGGQREVWGAELSLKWTIILFLANAIQPL